MEQLSQHLAEYGVLGILVAAFGYALWQQWKRVNEKNDLLELRLDALQDSMHKYLEEEREQMLQVIRDNTHAFVDLKDILSQLVDKKPARKIKQITN